MDRLRNFEIGWRRKINLGAKINWPWNNLKKLKQTTQMGEELYRYQRRPYIDRHWNRREIRRCGPKRMGPEIKGEGREISNINLKISSKKKGTHFATKLGDKIQRQPYMDRPWNNPKRFNQKTKT